MNLQLEGTINPATLDFNMKGTHHLLFSFAFSVLFYVICDLISRRKYRFIYFSRIVDALIIVVHNDVTHSNPKFNYIHRLPKQSDVALEAKPRARYCIPIWVKMVTPITQITIMTTMNINFDNELQYSK